LGRLAVSLRDSGRTVEIRREDVVNEFWSLARAHWGSGGPTPSMAIEIDTERFLARLGWLAPACRQECISIEWEPEVAQLVISSREERGRLDATLDDPEVLDLGVVLDRLGGGGYRRALRDFQLQDLRRVLGLPNAANFSVPGAGKTAVELACFAAERAVGRVERMLVAAPISAYESWQEEVRECFEDPPRIHVHQGGSVPGGAEIVLLNYQRLLYSYPEVAAWVADRPTLLCLDEAHRIKRGRSGGWGSACLDLAYLAARRDVLTGTPAPQSPADIGVLLDFLWLGQGSRILPSAVWFREPPPGLGRQVAESIGPLFVRTTKSDLDLPPVEHRIQPVEPDALQREIYEALRSRFAPRRPLSLAQRAGFSRLGEIVMYLLEAATNPGLLTAGSSGDDPRFFRHPPLPVAADSPLAELLARYAAHETPSKFVALAQLLARNRQEGRKTLVWSSFVRNLELLRGELASLGPAVVHGGVPLGAEAIGISTREQELARFREDPDCWVLLANPAALGEGISLHTVCHDAVYLERTFNAGQYLQSIDRIHRLGLAPEVGTRVTFLVTPGTIDGAVAERVAKKAELMGQMLDDTDIATLSLPDEEDIGAPFDLGDRGDVEALFDHLAGDE
jgi:hypothetical protein